MVVVVDVVVVVVAVVVVTVAIVVVVVLVLLSGLFGFGVVASFTCSCHSSGGSATHESKMERSVAAVRFEAVTIVWYTAARHPAVPSLT